MSIDFDPAYAAEGLAYAAEDTEDDAVSTYLSRRVGSGAKPASPSQVRRTHEASRRALDVHGSVEIGGKYSWDGNGNNKFSAYGEGRIENDRGDSAGFNYEQSTDGSGSVTFDAKSKTDSWDDE